MHVRAWGRRCVRSVRHPVDAWSAHEGCRSRSHKDWAALTRPGIGSGGFKRSSAGSANDPLRPAIQAIQPSPCHAGLAEPPILQRLRTFSAFRTGYASPSPFGSGLVRRPMEHSSEFPPICDRDSTSRWTAQEIFAPKAIIALKDYAKYSYKSCTNDLCAPRGGFCRLVASVETRINLREYA